MEKPSSHCSGPKSGGRPHWLSHTHVHPMVQSCWLYLHGEPGSGHRPRHGHQLAPSPLSSPVDTIAAWLVSLLPSCPSVVWTPTSSQSDLFLNFSSQQKGSFIEASGPQGSGRRLACGLRRWCRALCKLLAGAQAAGVAARLSAGRRDTWRSWTSGRAGTARAL